MTFASISTPSLGATTDRLLALSLPFTSTLLIPAIQGTIPAYMMGFATIAVIICLWKNARPSQQFRTLRDWALWGVFFFTMVTVSQLGHILNGFDPLIGLNFISGGTHILLRSSLITQSIYFVACFAIFVYFRNWFDMKHIGWVYAAGWIIVIYGIYEWTYYLVFKDTGDFLVNRTFDDGHTASWSQIREIGGLGMIRIKSTFGEPSFFCGAAVPFFYAAILGKRKFLAAALLFCIIFTWSTSGYAGTFVGMIMLGALKPQHIGKITIGLLAMSLALFAYHLAFPESFQDMFVDKIRGDNDSGAVRQDLSAMSRLGEQKRHMINILFGVGFGYIYGGMWEAGGRLNLGYVGCLIMAAFFLAPYVYSLKGTTHEPGWAIAAALILFLFVINLSEAYIPTTWAFLGLAYRSMDQAHHRRRVSSSPEIPAGTISMNRTA